MPIRTEKQRARRFIFNFLIPVVGIISISLGLLLGSSVFNLFERLHPSVPEEAPLKQEIP